MVFEQYRTALAMFGGSKYASVLETAARMLDAGDSESAEKKLKELPTERELLIQLIEKLKGKSVYDTLIRINAGKATYNEELKGWFSLGTHVAIEIDHGAVEYRVLLTMVHERIGALLAGV